MAKKRNYLKLQAKPLQNDSNCFLLSDEDDSDDSEIVVPSSQAKRRIFQNPPRQKPRPSLIRRNLNEFVSSTPMHPARKTFNGSLHLSPIENEPPERQVRRNSKSLQMEIIPSTQESSKRKNATKPVKKKDVTKNNSELGNKSVLARPLQSTVSSSEDNTNNNEKEREITRVDTRKTLCTEVQTSFKSPLCRITKSYCNVLTQTAVDKGTILLQHGRDSRRSSTRSRTTRQSSTNKNDNPEDDEDDPTLTENTIGRNLRSASEKLQRTPKKDANRTKGQSAERSLTTAEKLQRTPKKDANRTKGQSAERSLTTAVQKNKKRC
ncbi:hypothetical protein QE152_g32316 [Popillia japonica]|uniref:Uncharacterized protein n=1 Tax=Popillia japonica TaxID=7064 RepID=A0AAW1IZS7_POPJA